MSEQTRNNSKHVIDTRFTWSGERAEEFLELVKEEFGGLIPYGGICHLIRFACIYYLEVRKKAKDNDYKG